MTILNKDKVVATRLTTKDYELFRRMALSDDCRLSQKLRNIIKQAIKEVEEDKILRRGEWL